MNLKVFWSESANITFDSVVSYLEDNFCEKTALKFANKVYNITIQISKTPYIYKASEIDKNLRKATISKQSSFLYEVHKNSINILFFLDNRQEPVGL